ncbi:MAG: glycoside hydrolase family 127 protein [Bacteroidales bacterium]|nr:glycoside hydrolase family 127 protein [Bacteroidales bacterium]
MKKILILLFILFIIHLKAQERALTNTTNSSFAVLQSTDIDDVKWTKGFWAERFAVCRDSMVTNMLRLYKDPDISHSFRNFEIAAGLADGTHKGPPFHDGDFFKLFEAMAMVYAVDKNPETDREMDEIIDVIARSQRSDGYIHTPVVIEEKNSGNKTEFMDRMNFETYNMGHLMTAACIHYRATGKKSLLDVAVKATDFLYGFYKNASPELARNAICPSHYMGVVEMYRTTRDPRYLELAKSLIDIRGMVADGTDHNQDRVPFRKQTEAVGHAVRANYLYAGVADVFAETGDDSLFTALDLIWHDVIEKKMYITGACGALYDGVSPDGITYDQPYIQQVHQAYGRPYQLPNITAHNESCANIGNLLWNWRMFLITGDARFTDMMEVVMYNSLLSAVSLDGKRHFYTNPLCVNHDLPYTLRWSKEREEYISYCNCCPPNTIRTVAEISNYFYTISDKGLWINFYGGNSLRTNLKDGSPIELTMETDYPWDGKAKISIEKVPGSEFSLFMRIPGWCKHAHILLNNKKLDTDINPGKYLELKRKWSNGDILELVMEMQPTLIESHPLVEETRNQAALKYGPVVYCLESPDIPSDIRIFDIVIPADIMLTKKLTTIDHTEMLAFEGEASVVQNASWDKTLYRELSVTSPKPLKIKLIPYLAWGNRGRSEMTVWIPVSR